MRCAAEAAELWPERAADDRSVHPAYGFPLDERTAADGVIARGQRFNPKIGSRLQEESRNTAPFLVHISHDPHSGTVAHDSARSNHKPAPNHNRLARSRSEGA